MKPSEVLRMASKVYKRARGSLYKQDENGNCKVCAMGALALVGKPERFYVKDGYIFDNKTNEIATTLDIMASYDDVDAFDVYRLKNQIILKNDRRSKAYKYGMPFAHIARYLESEGY